MYALWTLGDTAPGNECQLNTCAITLCLLPRHAKYPSEILGNGFAVNESQTIPAFAAAIPCNCYTPDNSIIHISAVIL